MKKTALPSAKEGNRKYGALDSEEWLSVSDAAKKLSCSAPSIERRAIEWREQPVPFKFRYVYLVWDEGGEPERRYCEADLNAVLFTPDRLPRASKARLRPRYIR